MVEPAKVDPIGTEKIHTTKVLTEGNNRAIPPPGAAAAAPG
jgi:hypothetical protein